MSLDVDMYVINKNGVIVDVYYLGGQRVANHILSAHMGKFDRVPGEFHVWKLHSVVAKDICEDLKHEEDLDYLGNQIDEFIKDLNTNTYNDSTFWFNIMIS